MYKDVLSDIEGISIYPVFSFIVFFTFFSLLLFWMMKTKKKDFEEISQIPFNDK